MKSVKAGEYTAPPAQGPKIFVIEAMKMENDIESDRDGIVKKIAVTKGDSVYEGDTLLVLSV
jgi:biotin carboxyl carrier protein